MSKYSYIYFIMLYYIVEKIKWRITCTCKMLQFKSVHYKSANLLTFLEYFQKIFNFKERQLYKNTNIYRNYYFTIQEQNYVLLWNIITYVCVFQNN